MTALASARGNLKFAKQEFAQREKLLEELALSSAKYWVPGNGSKLEQEINAEIGKILRKAQVQATQKVDASRERNGSFLQEVYVSIEMKSVSMQSIARFFKEFANYKNAPKFVWENCKIGPDNSRAPNGVNLTLKFKVMALNEDAVKLLNDGNN